MSDKKKTGTVNRAAFLVLLLLTVLAVISIFAGIRNAARYSQDFQYDAARALMKGVDPYVLSELSREKPLPDAWYEGIKRAGLEPFYEYYESIDAPQKMEANQFPSLLYLLEPVAVMPFKAARICWLILNLLFTAAIIFLLRKTFLKNTDKKMFAVLSCLMIAGTPWRNQLGVGQHTLFSFAFFLLAVWLSELSGIVLISGDGRNAGRDCTRLRVISGLVLAVSYFKYTLTAPLALYFVYKRRWKELIISVIPHIAGTAAAALSLGEPVLQMIIKPLKVSMALSGEGSLDIGAMLGGGRAAMIASLAVMLVLVILAFVFPDGRDEIFFSAVLLLGLVFTYHRTYDFFVLIAVYGGVNAAGLIKENSSGRILKGLYALLLLYIFFGLRFFHESPASVMAAAFFYYAFTLFFLLSGLRKYESHVDT
ncbi:MAG: DUF2029 domain-containing protein [Lachnospiraceae bacterium]|nr:DUF2029 domain-containing protein [Lachnospiraceae bacterium]